MSYCHRHNLRHHVISTCPRCLDDKRCLRIGELIMEAEAKDAEIAALREANAKLHNDRKSHDDYIQESSAIKSKHIRNIQTKAKVEVLREVLEDFSVEYQPFRGLRDCIRHLEDKLKALEATK